MISKILSNTIVVLKPEYDKSVPTTWRGDWRKSHKTAIVDILHVVHLTSSYQA